MNLISALFAVTVGISPINTDVLRNDYYPNMFTDLNCDVSISNMIHVFGGVRTDTKHLTKLQFKPLQEAYDYGLKIDARLIDIYYKHQCRHIVMAVDSNVSHYDMSYSKIGICYYIGNKYINLFFNAGYQKCGVGYTFDDLYVLHKKTLFCGVGIKFSYKSLTLNTYFEDERYYKHHFTSYIEKRATNNLILGTKYCISKSLCIRENCHNFLNKSKSFQIYIKLLKD